jgi:hypothetical protein
MNRILTYGKWFVLFIPVMLLAKGASIDKITNSIRTGDVAQLSQYFDESLEIITPDSDGVYSQNQAVQVLKTFFQKYPCSGFELSHTGNSAGGSKFLIASYESGSNSFRVSVFLKKEGENFLIQELTFEE